MTHSAAGFNLNLSARVPQGAQEMNREVVREFIRRMPKVELHLHLEGSIREGVLQRLAGGAVPRDLYRHVDFNSFLQAYKRACQLLKAPEDFELITYQLLAELAAQNTLYAEVMLSPSVHRRNGLPVVSILEAIERAARRARTEFGIEMRLILDAVRQWGPDEMSWMVELAIEHQGLGIVGVGIGGDELAAEARLFRGLYERARSEGLHLTAHAGEVAGAESVRQAVEELGVERVGHGIRAVEDPGLLALLRRKGVTLDVSLTSNLSTGAVRHLSEHPLPQLLRAGIKITINSDDPAIFATTLTEEYRSAAESFDLDIARIEQLSYTAAAACFLPDGEKQQLIEKLRREISLLRGGLGLEPD